MHTLLSITITSKMIKFSILNHTWQFFITENNIFSLFFTSQRKKNSFFFQTENACTKYTRITIFDIYVKYFFIIFFVGEGLVLEIYHSINTYRFSFGDFEDAVHDPLVPWINSIVGYQPYLSTHVFTSYRVFSKFMLKL